MTKIKRCYCKSEYQDKRYGKGRRVFNDTRVPPEGDVWRCTVCGKETTKGGSGGAKPKWLS